MLNKALDKELQRGLPGSMYYLWSEESFFLEEALKRSIEILMPDSQSDFNLDIFDESSAPGEIIDTASTMPFISRRRLVVLKGFNQFSKPAVKSLLAYFTDPLESTCMLVLSKKAPSKALSEVKWKPFKLGISENEVPAWLRRLAADKGIEMTGKAAACMVENVGFDIGLLVSEVEKLALLGKKKIDEKDITSSISSVREYTTFNLIDALVAEQKARAFRILRSILAGKVFATTVLGTLNWHYREFYNLWLNKGKKPQKMRMSTYSVLSKYLDTYREESFRRIFQSLHEADLAIKSSGRPELVLEVLLIKLLQKRIWS